MPLSFLKDALGLAGAGFGLYNMATADNDNPFLDAQMAEMQERQRLRQIGLNPEHPEFKKALALREEADRLNFSRALSEAITRGQRARARNQVSTRGERHDEMASALAQRISAGPRGRMETQQTFLNAAGQPNFAGGIAAQNQQNIYGNMLRHSLGQAGVDTGTALIDVLSRFSGGGGSGFPSNPSAAAAGFAGWGAPAARPAPTGIGGMSAGRPEYWEF